MGAGVTLKVNMTGPAKDYDLYLYNSAGTQLAKSAGSTATESVTYKNSGTSAVSYYIYVMGYNGANSTSPYNLALTKSGSQNTVAVSLNPTSATLTPSSTKQFTPLYGSQRTRHLHREGHQRGRHHQVRFSHRDREQQQRHHL